MKILVNTGNYEILNSLIRQAKEHGNTIIIGKIEEKVFNYIGGGEIDAYIFSSSTSYAQKAVDFVKKSSVYTPVGIVGNSPAEIIIGADTLNPFVKDSDTDYYAKSLLHNIYAYIKNFETLQRLTAKMADEVEFKNGRFDPTRRLLYYGDVEICKLSPKQSGVFEILAANYGTVVRKEIILEKVWHESNYFVGRSLDVYVTHLRKIFREHNMSLAITNVSNVGLMLNDLVKK